MHLQQMAFIMNTFPNSKGSFLTPLKKLVYLLSLFGLSNAAGANTFPTAPLHLQDETTTTTPAGVKPNIMLYIDDSGSMYSSVAGTGTSRIGVVQRALNGVLLKYKDEANWGIETLYNYVRPNLTTNTTRGLPLSELQTWGLGINTATWCSQFGSRINWTNSKTITPKDDLRQNFTSDYQEIRKRVACLYGNGPATPVARRYGEITTGAMVHKDNLKNRCQKSYVVLLSDGDPNGDSGTLNTRSWSVYNNDQKTYGGDAWNVSWNDPKYPTQNIITYTVGFGSGLSSSGRSLLQKSATPSTSNFYTAMTADDLTSAFDSIFDSIKSENKAADKQVYSATAPAISSNYVEGMAAAASLHTGSWSSEILFYDIDRLGKLDTSKPKRASFNKRKLLVSDGQSVGLYSNLFGGYNNAWYQINDNYLASNRNNSTEWRDGLLRWMARESSDAAIKNSNSYFTLDYRVRPMVDANNNALDQRSMGDIIDNSILAIGEMKNKRQEFVLTSTNDGLVYVFQAQNSNNNPYDLVFNYAPAKMERSSNDGSDYVGKYYKDTTRNAYGQDSISNPHRYLLNGGMIARSTDAHGKGKQIFVASTMGQAGRGAFAINVGGVNRDTGSAIAANNVANANWYHDVKLFETQSGASNQLGFTVGSPQIGRVQADTASTAVKNDTGAHIHYGVFVSNGYNYKANYKDPNSQYADTPSLYVYEGLGQDVGLTPTAGNYTKGSLLKKFVIPGGSGGLATPTLVDVNFDGVIDYAYAGDFGGGLYRFNLNSPNPNQWSVTKIYQTASKQPITSAPAVFRNDANKYTVVFGTGSEIYQEDLNSKDKQALYGIFDDLSLEGSAAQVNTAELLPQTLSTETLAAAGKNLTVRKVSNHPIQSHHRGWSIALDAVNGERITVKPNVMGNSVLLSTRVYEQQIISNTGDDPCLEQTQQSSSSAYSWLLQFNLSNGGLISSGKNSVYIDFNLGESAKFKSTDNQQYLISGQQFTNLTSITVIDRLVEGFSVSTNGDSGGSGEDPVLNPHAKIPKNTCVGDGSKVFSFDTGGTSVTYDIHGACRPEDRMAYTRLSWREIF